MFLALAIEFKVGGLDIKSLEKRNRYAGFFGDGKEQPVPFRVAASKYPGIDLYDPVLSNDLVADVFGKGSIDRNLIASSLAASTMFTEPAEVAS